MAVWNPDNIVLTNKGREILAKVQAGQGKITLSSVVSSDGYVSPSQLILQESVVNPVQELTVTGVSYKTSGSIIDVKLTNTELEKEYTLHQIGIYVTHDDYDGDVLYMIAQCDTDSADTIPLPSETPVTITFSFFLENATESNITITVDPAGSVSVDSFNKHVENTEVHFSEGEKDKMLTTDDKDVPNGIPSLDETGKIKKEQLPEISDLKANVQVVYNGGGN